LKFHKTQRIVFRNQNFNNQVKTTDFQFYILLRGVSSIHLDLPKQESDAPPAPRPIFVPLWANQKKAAKVEHKRYIEMCALLHISPSCFAALAAAHACIAARACSGGLQW
jgi:hypothetical protein